MRATGDYAVFQGREYQVVSRGSWPDGRRYVGLILDDDLDDVVSGFDRVERQTRPPRRLGFTTTARLDRYERVTTTGVFDGEPVTLYGTQGEIPCLHSRDPGWAELHGWSGSQHDGGWSGHAPLDLISTIHEHTVDLFRPEDHLSLIISAHHHPDSAGFAPPATAADFDAYRTAFGEDFPPGLAEIYRTIGGGPFFDTTLLSVEHIIRTRRMWDAIIADSTPDDGYDEHIQSHAPHAVSAAYWKPGWVQFTADGGGNGFAIDLAPEHAGTPGQVINVGSDDDHRQRYAASVPEFLSRLATLIRTGRATPTNGHWNFTHPEHPDPSLLTALDTPHPHHP